jgi:HK97 gp10 family phage protein
MADRGFAGGPSGQGNFRFTSYFGNVTERIVAAQGRAAERVGKAAYDLARDLCPVDTGALRDSITYEVRRVATGWAVVVLAGEEYALYVELGTSRMEAQPFLRPALDRVGPMYVQFLREELAADGLGRAA